MYKKLRIIIIVAFLLRLIISPFTYHSDVQPFDLGGYVLSKGYVLNFYDFFPKLSSDDQIKKTFHDYNFNYPPAVYFTLGGVSNVFSLLVPDNFRYDFLFNVKTTLGSPLFYLHLFTLKLPYFFFDFAIAFLLFKMFKVEKQKLLVVSMWLFNPISIYSSYMMGQFDVIPTFFTILALYLVVSKNTTKSYYLAALSLGLGAAFKIYPLFLLIPLMSITSDWRSRVNIFILGLLPYALLILPFLPSHGFRSSALVAGQTMKSFYAQIPVSGGEAIILFVAVLFFIYLLFLKFRAIPQLLWMRFLVTMLIFFIFTHFHPQWLVWLTPFLIIEAVESNLKNMLAKVTIYLSWFGMIWFFDPGLNIGLLSPIFPALFDSQSIWQMLQINIDYNFARSILQSIFVAGTLIYVYFYFPKRSDS